MFYEGIVNDFLPPVLTDIVHSYLIICNLEVFKAIIEEAPEAKEEIEEEFKYCHKKYGL